MRLENALARKIGDVSFDNEVLILDHKRGWQPIAILHIRGVELEGELNKGEGVVRRALLLGSSR